MTNSQAFSLYQPLLYAQAIRILGSARDAEDMVQETFLKWLSIGPEKIEHTRAYLISALRNNCLKYKATLSQRKNEWLEQLPEALEKLQFHPTLPFSFEEDIRQAMNVVQHKLEPLEKGIFILREVFQFEYEDLQEIFEKKKDHCRQLFSRARKKLAGTPDVMPIKIDQITLWEKMENAIHKGKLADLIQFLKNDI